MHNVEIVTKDLDTGKITKIYHYGYIALVDAEHQYVEIWDAFVEYRYSYNLKKIVEIRQS